MAKDTELRKALLKQEYEQTFRDEMRLREDELKIMKRRRTLAIQLEAIQDVEAPVLHLINN